MTAYLDTNILVRHLTGDPPDMAARATHLLATQPELILVDLVAAEMVYVLESFYEAPRAQVAEALRSLVAMDTVRCDGASVLLRAAEVYERHRLDFAEAYLVACAESTGATRIASFDRTIDRVGTVERIEPQAA
jgi:predicted nucleic acid-binding protein